MSNEIYYTVEKIRKSPQGYTFFISSSMGTKFEMLVSNDQYERFDIAEGERIDDEHFLKIREEMLFDNARRHAFTILSYGDNNKKTLVIKLMQRGYSRELCENVALYMEHRGYIDEKKQMGILLETCLKKKYGKIKIAEEFIAKGFKRDDAVEYLKGSLEGIDFGESCAFIISQKYNPLPKDKEELSKMMASLMRYGYSINDIKAGIRIFAEGEKNGN